MCMAEFQVDTQVQVAPGLDSVDEEIDPNTFPFNKTNGELRQF